LTDSQPEWEAGEECRGVNYIPITLSISNGAYYCNRLRTCIENARSTSDIAIFSSHVGPHFRENPSTEYIDFAHRVLNLGADIYWGPTNHMPQGIEIYKDNKIVMYDCGDFIDDYAVDSAYRNDLSFIFLLHLVGITLVLPMGILKAAAGMSATVIVGIFAQEIRFIRRMWGMTFMMLAMMMSTQEIREQQY
jgi:hypothetical protein